MTGEGGCSGGFLLSTVVAPMRREVVVAREMQAEKAQASLNSPGTTEAACWSASRCAKVCTNCKPRSATYMAEKVAGDSLKRESVRVKDDSLTA